MIIKLTNLNQKIKIYKFQIIANIRKIDNLFLLKKNGTYFNLKNKNNKILYEKTLFIVIIFSFQIYTYTKIIVDNYRN